MKSWTETIRRRAAWVGVMLAGVALAAHAADLPVENLRLPLEYYPDGRIKTQITAGEARMSGSDGPIEAKNVVVEMYETNGIVQGRMTSAACRIDRAAGVGTSDADVKLEANGATITGTGFEWNAATRTVMILSNVKVVLQKNMKLPVRGRGAASGEKKTDAEANP